MFRLPVLFLMLLVSSLSDAQTNTLYVYGPGGPFSAINECAKAFTASTHINVKVIAGPEAKWIRQAAANADLIYGGSEYMLTQFLENHPGMIDKLTRTGLYKRAAAILVRPGNPKNIQTLKDLSSPGISLLDVNGSGQVGLWEDLAGKQDLIEPIQKNIAGSFKNTALAIEAWNEDPHYDAWITYASWHQNLKESTQLISLPADHILYRGTPIALTSRTKNTNQANQFLAYLKSPAGHAIFKIWGWE